MSSRIVLNNFMAPPTISSKRSATQATSSEVFPDFVYAVQARESGSEDNADSPSPYGSNNESAQETTGSAETTNSGSSGQLEANTASETLGISLSEPSDLEGVGEQTGGSANSYGQNSVDASVMGKSLLNLIQSVQEGDVPQAQAALSQISRKISSSQSASAANATPWYTATNPLQRFVSEMQTALTGNDVQGAQASLSSFLENAGRAKGNFVAISA